MSAQSPTGASLQSHFFRDVLADLKGNLAAAKRPTNFKNVIWALFSADIFIILLTFRLRTLVRKYHIPFLNRLLRGLQLALYGIELGNEIELGHGVTFVHSAGVVVGGCSKVGAYCIFMGSNTIGTALGNGEPIIGCGVEIGCGARVLGPITVGDHAKIGANAVVLHDVPAGATVVGIPAKAIGKKN